MGNRGSIANDNYQLIKERPSTKTKRYEVYYVTGGQRFEIQGLDLKKIFTEGKIKGGIIDKNINVFVICRSFKDLYNKFILNIKPKFYEIYCVEHDFDVEYHKRELLVKPKINTEGNRDICAKYFTNILIEKQGTVDNTKLFKNKPNCIIIK